MEKMNTYLFSGTEVYRQEKALQYLLDKNEIEKGRTSVFDASDVKTFSTDAVLYECDSFSLFDEGKKAVVIKEPFFLNPAAKGKESDKSREYRMSRFEQYLRSPNPNTLLIFYCHCFDADKRKKEYKMLEKYKAVIQNFIPLKPWEFEDYLDKEIRNRGLKLDRNARKELLLRVNSNSLLLNNALEKILLYGKTELDVNDIEHLIPQDPEVNIFKMSNAFIYGDIASIIRSKEEMKNAGYDEIGMIVLLSARLRTLYNCLKLYETGLNEKMIAARLRSKEYPVRKNLESCYGITSHTLLSYLNELADIEQNAKKGKLDVRLAFEQFLLRNGGNQKRKGFGAE